jgi:hypothetical protein
LSWRIPELLELVPECSTSWNRMTAGLSNPSFDGFQYWHTQFYRLHHLFFKTFL